MSDDSLGRSPDTATAEDLRRYQLHLTDNGVSRVRRNAAVTALRFFFEVTLGRAELMAKMTHVHEPCTLPVGCCVRTTSSACSLRRPD